MPGDGLNVIRTAQANPGPDMIDFGIGQPARDLLPLDLMRRAADSRLRDGDSSLLAYGYEYGDGYFRLALARFLRRRYGFPVAADSLMVTAGASQGLDLVCSCFSRPGDVVLVEEPTYFLALRIFADRGLKVVGLPIDEEGLAMDSLTAALAEHQPAFLYTIPTFQNPTGITMAKKRRQQLVALSQAHDFLVVADEVYQLLDYGEPSPPPLANFINSEHVLSVGSFSKILAPGLRLGWIQAAPALLQKLAASGLVDSGGALNQFTSNLVRVVLEEGWQDAYLADLKLIYGERLAVMSEALNHYLGTEVHYYTPAGGYFFWAGLAEKIDTAKLLESALKHQVGFQPGIKFSSSLGQRDYMRLSFAFYDESEIEQGIKRLARAIAETQMQ